MSVESAASTVDLDVIAQSTTGLGRIMRLVHIGDHDIAQRLDAYLRALRYIRADTLDTPRYDAVSEKLRAAINDSAGVGADTVAAAAEEVNVFGQAWMSQTERSNKMALSKLESEIKSCRGNMIKESTRIGYHELGETLMRAGDLENALQAFTKSKDYASSAGQIALVNWKLMEVNVARGQLQSMHSLASRLDSLPDFDEKPMMQQKMRVVCALASMADKQFHGASVGFLRVDSSVLDFDSIRHIVSPQEIARYAILTAMAKLPRSTYKTNVLDNAGFRKLAETVPQMRRLAREFHDGEFAKCLDALCSMQGDLQMDAYLRPILQDLLDSIRKSAMARYVQPYEVVDLERMRLALGAYYSIDTHGRSLEDDVVELIRSDAIQMRLDQRARSLVQVKKSHRDSSYQRALDVGSAYEKVAQVALTWMQLVQDGLWVTKE